MIRQTDEIPELVNEIGRGCLVVPPYWVALATSILVGHLRQVHVPNDAEAGDYTVDVTGSGINPDNSERVTSTAQTTTVEEPTTNSPPTANAGNGRTVDEGASVALDASGSSDPDGDSLGRRSQCH